MTLLRVPGAWLSHEMLGGGPLLVLVPGATGTGQSMRAVAHELAGSYRVVLYDRRGFSASVLDRAQDLDRRLDTDADDLHGLVTHLDGDGSATVMGFSSGATVALRALAHHPGMAATVVAFEPPAMRLLPDGQSWVDFFHQVYDLYQTSGPAPALQLFRERSFAASDRAALAQAVAANRDDGIRAQIAANTAYWFEHELRQYPAAGIDVEALRRVAERIVPAVGRDSAGYPCRQATEALASLLGRLVITLAGGHVGCLGQPSRFAHELVHALGKAGR